MRWSNPLELAQSTHSLLLTSTSKWISRDWSAVLIGWTIAPSVSRLPAHTMATFLCRWCIPTIRSSTSLYAAACTDSGAELNSSHYLHTGSQLPVPSVHSVNTDCCMSPCRGDYIKALLLGLLPFRVPLACTLLYSLPHFCVFSIVVRVFPEILEHVNHSCISFFTTGLSWEKFKTLKGFLV